MLFSCSTSYQSNFLIFYLDRTRKMCRLRVHLRAALKAARKPFINLCHSGRVLCNDTQTLTIIRKISNTLVGNGPAHSAMSVYFRQYRYISAGACPRRSANDRRHNNEYRYNQKFVILSAAKDLRTYPIANLYLTAEMLRRSLSMTVVFIFSVLSLLPAISHITAHLFGGR